MDILKIIIFYFVVLVYSYVIFSWSFLYEWMSNHLRPVSNKIRWILAIVISPMLGILLMTIEVFSVLGWITQYKVTRNPYAMLLLFGFPSFLVCALSTVFAPSHKLLVLRLSCILVFLFWLAFALYREPPKNDIIIVLLIFVSIAIFSTYWFIRRALNTSIENKKDV